MQGFYQKPCVEVCYSDGEVITASGGSSIEYEATDDWE